MNQKVKKDRKKLNDYEFLELKEYEKDELLEMFVMAICEMSDRGVLSPRDTKEYLANIQKWLIEELEN